jgi:4-hydroxybenzoate polyprenyltransferase
MPARWGLAAALRVSTVFHAGTVFFLIAVARNGGLGVVAYVGIAVVAGILYWEHRIVAPDDLSRVDMAFFNLNGYVSVLLLASVAADVLL